MSINSVMNGQLTDSACLPLTQDPDVLRSRAKAMRRHVLRMAEIVGQGYVGQGLGIADVLAVIYFSQLRTRPNEPTWPDRDRFVLSIGHYAIGLYAALAEAGIIPIAELDTYGADESRLEMSAPETTPGVEMTGGSLGHGLGASGWHGVGIATAKPRGTRLQSSLGWRMPGGFYLGSGDGRRASSLGSSHGDHRLQ